MLSSPTLSFDDVPNHQLVASENLAQYRPAHSSSPANSHSSLAWRALFILHSTALWA